jgi:streptogramin lyase
MGVAFTPGTPFAGAYVSGYKSGTPGVQTITPTFDTNTFGISGISAGTNQFGTTLTGPYADESDGAGTVWVADFNDHAIGQTNPAASTANLLKPCVGAVTACVAFTGKPTNVSIDSTGAVWAPFQAGANVIQIIGSAAPTWPLLSLGKTGKP